MKGLELRTQLSEPPALMVGGTSADERWLPLLVLQLVQLAYWSACLPLLMLMEQADSLLVTIVDEHWVMCTADDRPALTHAQACI